MATEKNVPLCTECALPLSGGIDTYGGYGESLCFSCYMGSVAKTNCVTALESELISARDLLESADDEEEDARCQAERCASAVRDLETKIQKLKGGKE